jgi:hypothetical protein
MTFNNDKNGNYDNSLATEHWLDLLLLVWFDGSIDLCLLDDGIGLLTTKHSLLCLVIFKILNRILVLDSTAVVP